jgi:dihydroneopterin triphosphate diphosphatase
MTTLHCNIIEVCIFAKNAGVPRYLVLRRSADNDLYPGIWQFVSGRVEENEEAYRAALRELHEETQLHIRRFYVVPHVSSFYDAGRDALNHVAMFAAEVDGDSAPILSREHQSHRWCSYADAADLLVWPGQREGLKVVQEFIVEDGERGRLADISGMAGL